MPEAPAWLDLDAATVKGVRMTEAELAEYERKQGARRIADVQLARKHGKTIALAAMRKVSPLEIRFEQQLAENHIFQAKEDEPMGYWRNWLNAIPGRNFELDFAFPRLRFAVEIDGMAHRTKGRFVADFEKHALLLLEGWKILRVCGKDVREGRAIAWTLELLRRAP